MRHAWDVSPQLLAFWQRPCNLPSGTGAIWAGQKRMALQPHNTPSPAPTLCTFQVAGQLASSRVALQPLHHAATRPSIAVCVCQDGQLLPEVAHSLAAARGKRQSAAALSRKCLAACWRLKVKWRGGKLAHP